MSNQITAEVTFSSSSPTGSSHSYGEEDRSSSKSWLEMQTQRHLTLKVEIDERRDIHGIILDLGESLIAKNIAETQNVDNEMQNLKKEWDNLLGSWDSVYNDLKLTQVFSFFVCFKRKEFTQHFF